MRNTSRVVPLLVEVDHISVELSHGLMQIAEGISMGAVEDDFRRFAPGLVPILPNLLDAAVDPSGGGHDHLGRRFEGFTRLLVCAPYSLHTLPVAEHFGYPVFE